MRMESAAIAKGRGANYHLAPREGSTIRALFDFFHAHKGRLVCLDMGKSTSCSAACWHTRISNLVDFYGMDIRHMGGKSKTYCFVGEWFGKTYIDYVTKELKL